MGPVLCTVGWLAASLAAAHHIPATSPDASSWPPWGENYPRLRIAGPDYEAYGNILVHLIPSDQVFLLRGGGTQRPGTCLPTCAVPPPTPATDTVIFSQIHSCRWFNDTREAVSPMTHSFLSPSASLNSSSFSRISSPLGPWWTPPLVSRPSSCSLAIPALVLVPGLCIGGPLPAAPSLQSLWLNGLLQVAPV